MADLGLGGTVTIDPPAVPTFVAGAPSVSTALVVPVSGPPGGAGSPGPPNVLTIGTVGSGTAAASITGTTPAQVLNLTMPPAFRYIGSDVPDTTGWAVNNIWLDTSTET